MAGPGLARILRLTSGGFNSAFLLLSSRLKEI